MQKTAIEKPDKMFYQNDAENVNFSVKKEIWQIIGIQTEKGNFYGCS